MPICRGQQQPRARVVALRAQLVRAWIAHREGREGAFVDLTETDTASASHGQHKKNFLRNVARRAAMDYLTKVPASINSKLPDSVESADLRAGQITSVLDDILHQPPPPPLDLRH